MELSHAFPLTSRLPSNRSAAFSGSALFAVFIGTMQLSDCLSPFITGARLLTSRRGPVFHLSRTTIGSPGSRQYVSAHAWVLRLRGACSVLASIAPSSVAFDQRGLSRRSDLYPFRSSIPYLCIPLSTLIRQNYSCLTMTRGQTDWLDLVCRGLSPLTYCRFHRRTPVGASGLWVRYPGRCPGLSCCTLSG